MINFQLFMLGLLLVSILTGLTTEAIKNIYKENNKTYYANTLAGVVALVLSIAVGVWFIFIKDMGFTGANVSCVIALAFMSWLCAMVGYDKVIQAISQFKTSVKE